MGLAARVKATLFACSLLIQWPCLAADNADGATALPEPLTLDYALSLSDDAHPDLLLAAAERDIAQAQHDRAEAAYGLNASVNAQALWIEPAASARDQSQNDSQVSLLLSKRLYDFGHTRASVAAAQAQTNNRALLYSDARLQRGLTILERYLDVLLADLEFRLQDEAMAIAYVRLDRIRDRHELKQVSDVERLEAETQYQESRSARIAAQAKQRTRRVRLAEAMNRPGQLSSTLAEPDLSILEQTLPKLDVLMADVFAGNTRLQALRAQRDVEQSRLQAARALDQPVLSGVAEASEFQRGTGTRDPWTAGLQLQVPLYSGGRSAAGRAQARAELRRQEALLASGEAELREQVQILWEEIQVLQASRAESKTRLDYRELYLDRSRALYEMEVKTDLGDAMVLSADARLRETQLEYHLLLDWAQLNVLRGQPVLTAVSMSVEEAK